MNFLKLRAHFAHVLMAVLCLAVSSFALSAPSLADDLGGVGGSGNGSSQTSNQDQQGWQPAQGNQPTTKNDAPGSDMMNEIMGGQGTEGDFIKGGAIDQDQVAQGFMQGKGFFAWVSILIGWGIGFLVSLIVLTNLLGLIYVAVPIGPMRKLLSGGKYGQAPAGAAGGMGMGGYGMRSGMGMGGMGMGGMGMGGYGMRSGMGMGGMGMGAQPAQMGGTLSNLTLIPESAIIAVNMAESGMGGGEAGGQMGMMTPMGQQGQSMEQVNPVMYYFKAQVKTLLFTGIAVVVLILSSFIFDTGIDLGQLFLSAMQSILKMFGVS